MSKIEQINSCFNTISTFCDINNIGTNVKKSLNLFFGDYLRKRRVPTTLQVNTMLEKLLSLSDSEKSMLSIINKSIEMGWASFYPISNSYQKKSIDNIPISKKEIKDIKIKLADEEF